MERTATDITREESAQVGGVADTMRELSGCIQQLEDLGLSLDPAHPQSTDDVEHVLITDSWDCPSCGTCASSICPSSGKPHRRRLVGIAQRAIRLIERHVGKVYVRPAQLSRRVEGAVQVRTQRRLTMNPHTFLLSFYFAAHASTAVPPSESQEPPPPTAATPECDPALLTSECARHMLDILREIKLYGTAPADDAYSVSLFKSFRSAWQQYQSQMKTELSENHGQAPQPLDTEAKTEASWQDGPTARDELVRCTRLALMDAVTHSRKEPANLDLRRFTALLYQRLSRLCTKEEFEVVKRRVEEIEARDTTPKIEYERPPCMLSDANTTTSDDDERSNTAQLGGPSPSSFSATAAQRRIGPELPPGWYVDASGVSRPPADLAATQRRERYLQKELKAQKAYEAVITVRREKGQAEELQENAVAALDTAELRALAADLNRTPPRLQRLTRLLAIVEDRFVAALPPRLRSRVRQEFHDVLDWNVIQRRARGSAVNTADLVRFVGQQVIRYSAPAREEATAARMASICRGVECCEPDVGTAVANAFEFLFEAIAELHADVAAYSLLLINDALKQNAVTFLREFIGTCLPPPLQWSKSIAFLQGRVHDLRVVTWASSNVPLAWTSITVEECRVRGALLTGTLDLLCSGQHTSLDRWSDLPPEIFYFEKHVIFKAANTVQECTLLLMLEGTVSSMLARRGTNAVAVSATILKLHDHILQLLETDIKLNALKESVLDFIESELYHLYVGTGPLVASAALRAVAERTTLTDAEKQMARSTIDTMTNTQSPLYLAFERRVIKFMDSMLMENKEDVAPLGLVTDSLKRLVQLLRHMLIFHWEVYKPYYHELMPLLHTAPSTAAGTP